MIPTTHAHTHRREILVILVMTIVGGLIRIWAPSHLGLVHFDEGIYAMAGLWPVLPGGFWGIDPSTIAYAPGGFPFLIGLSNFVLGPSDLSAILVSVTMGTLTIPLVGWLTWRTFGPTAGAITATFAATSGFHIAFSRMALTDVSFLFFFLLALGMGQRFLERPNVWNTIALGIAVGLTQWFKYHGWLAGAIVALTALVRAMLDPAERQPKRLASIWGQGACAALIAFAVFWPWFRFVESHGGYADLLRHHASYMQGFRPWFANLRTQFDQNAFLGTQASSVLVFIILCVLGGNWRRRILGLGGAIALLGWHTSITFGGLWGWAIGLCLFPGLLITGTARSALLGIGWLVFSVLTPLYHPYARLWLPLEALGWLMLGYLFSAIIATEIQPAPRLLSRPNVYWFLGSLLFIGVLFFSLRPGPGGRIFTDSVTSLGAPSDSLRTACRQIQGDLPKNLGRLRFLGRPPITFYLATAGVAVVPQPDLNGLLIPGNPSDWALVDNALLRQEPDHGKAKAQLLETWEIVREYPTTLNLPTLLDLNPGAARRKIEASTKECPLWLLRLRPRGTQ